MAQGVFALDEDIETAVKTIVIYLFPTHAEEVFEGAVLIPSIGGFEFAFVAAESGDGEDARDQRPRDGFAAFGEKVFEGGVEAKAPPQGEGEVDFAEIADPLDAQAADVDFGPPGDGRSGLGFGLGRVDIGIGELLEGGLAGRGGVAVEKGG